jgi:hypothetical protein
MGERKMKKLMLGLVAAFALTSFAAPVFAQEGGAADTTKPAGEKKMKKSKKGKKEKMEKMEKGGEAPPSEGEKMK